MSALPHGVRIRLPTRLSEQDADICSNDCRSTATVKLEMVDKHGVVLTDTFSVSFHMHFAKLLKWLAAGPLVACAGAVLSMQGRCLAHVLPTFRRSTE